nr:MAG TPA: hypothetical protein [Caudoviricetes sp.]
MLTKCCCKGNNKNNASPCFRLLQNEKSPRHAWTRVGGFGL